MWTLVALIVGIVVGVGMMSIVSVGSYNRGRREALEDIVDTNEFNGLTEDKDV